MSTDTPDLLRLKAELGRAGLLPFLEDSATENLFVNPDGFAYWAKGATTTGPHGPFRREQLQSLLQATASILGMRISPPYTFEATLPFREIRMSAVLPPVVNAPSIAFRIPKLTTLSLGDLVANGTLSEKAHDLLQAHLERESTIVISGAQNTGKTTLLRALLHRLLTEDPDLRLCVLEKGAKEMDLPGKNVVSMLADPLTPMPLLLETSLRFGARRLILGEARGAEALTLLHACNTGHPGSMTTLHANSGPDALQRFDTLVQHAGVPSQIEAIAEAVDLVVHLAFRDGRRVVATLDEVTPSPSSRLPDLAEIYAAP